MRPRARVVLLCVMPAVLSAQTPQGRNAGFPSGSWLIAMPAGADTNVFRFALRFDADGVIGGANTDGLPLRGAVRGDSVIFDVVGRPDGVGVRFAGTLEKGVIRGMRTQTPAGSATPSSIREFLATRDLPSRPPRLHAFSPQVFSRTFTGAAPPALRIIPGDTVRTWTLDNAGRDSTGTTRAPGGNPLTGPFYIEGALPGDMIAIRLSRVRPNRNSGMAGVEIVGNALRPDDLRRIGEVPDVDRRWRLDRERGVAMLEQPTSALGAYTVPLRPMLGCVGVAPFGGQAIFATESGPFGGNMDYSELREGVTIYLPVFQRGALLFLGDGHAVQGDGELTGDALETSMDVEFSVEVHPANRTIRGGISGPRAENDEFLMAIGIGGDLSDALRNATSDLARWLESDYRLTAPELGAVLGTRIRYDVAEVVGSEVSIVAKIPKAALRQLTRPGATEAGRPPAPGSR